VDVDTSAYDQGHVPELWDGTGKRNCRTRCVETWPTSAAWTASGSAGLTADTTVILYGDNNNWFAAWGFWATEYYGHKDVRLMNGGRKKWLEEKRPLSTDAPKSAHSYTVNLPTRQCCGRDECFSEHAKIIAVARLTCREISLCMKCAGLLARRWKAGVFLPAIFCGRRSSSAHPCGRNISVARIPGSEPVVVIAIQNHGRIRRKAGAAGKLSKAALVGQVSTHRVLQLRLPVPSHSSRHTAPWS